jgi:hypothetical protein
MRRLCETEHKILQNLTFETSLGAERLSFRYFEFLNIIAYYIL